MKSMVIVFLMGVAFLLMVPSCATVPTGPLAPGEVRLLGINIRETGNLRGNIQYTANINFEADGRPEITRACFSWSGDGPYCFKVRGVNYGSGTIEVDFRSTSQPGSYTLESYVLYIRSGGTRATNGVSTHVSVTRY